MQAKLIGLKRIESSKNGKKYTNAFLVFEDKEAVGKACGEALLNGHDLSDDLVGQDVEVEVDLRGHVQGIAPAMKAGK